MISVVGMKIDDLTILSESHKLSKEGWKIAMVEVKCECGTIRSFKKTEVINRLVSNCRQGVHDKNVTDLRNKVFHNWTVLSYEGNGQWKCKCICGTIKTLRSSWLTSGSSKSCGCKKFESMAKTNTLPNNKSQKNRILRTYKGHAKARNLEFKLSNEEFEELIVKECHYCGIQPSNIINPDSTNKYGNITSFRYNGIDRVDSSVGYTKENCVPCCKICNRSKGELPMNDWIEWIDRVNKHLGRDKDETQFNFDDGQLQAESPQSVSSGN